MNFFDLNLAGLESWCLDHDLPKFTAKQLRNWIWKHGVLDPEEMTNISAKARVAMQEHLTPQGILLFNQLALTQQDRELALDYFHEVFQPCFPEGTYLDTRSNFVFLNNRAFLTPPQDS